MAEAQSFNRRRLVTAFVSGAPGGREVEPTRPLRTLVAGLVVAALLLAGAAVLGLVKPRAPAGWLDAGTLVASKQRGTLYLVAEERDGAAASLQPFANATSAQLLLGVGATPVRVDQSAIDEQPLGPTIGIAGAPTTIPETSRLDQSGWSACATAGGVTTTLGADAATALPTATSDAAVVVRSGGALWLIAPGQTAYDEEPQTQRYRLGVGADALLRGLGLTARSADAETVDAAWLDLFPRGAGPLEAASLGAGDDAPVAYADRLGGRPLRVGDVVVADDVRYLLTETGPAELDPFALAVAAAEPGFTETRIDRAPGRAVARTWPASWPGAALTGAAGTPCAVLQTDGETPRVLLGVAGDVGAGEDDAVRVEPGHGAVVTPGGFDGEREGAGAVLVDSTGMRYPVQDAESLEHLGFDLEPPVVPVPWLDLFAEAATLSVTAAGRPPTGAVPTDVSR